LFNQRSELSARSVLSGDGWARVDARGPLPVARVELDVSLERLALLHDLPPALEPGPASRWVSKVDSRH